MYEESNEELGRQIAQDREAAGLTMTALALAVGTNKSTVSRIEAGSVKPFPETLVRIAEALGTQAEDYFVLAGHPTTTGLPGLAPYLRTKYGASDDVAREVEKYFDYLRSQDESNN